MPRACARTKARINLSAVNSVICVSSVIRPALPSCDGNSSGPREARPDLLKVPEVDLGPERVAHGAADQAGGIFITSSMFVSFLCFETGMDQGHSRAKICAADRALHGRKMSGSKTPWNVLRHRLL